MGPLSFCGCGKQAFQKLCVDTTTFESCGQVCEKVFNCGIHKCARVCHSGECEPCDIKVQVECYCGKENCLKNCQKFKEKYEESRVGSYSCHQKCERPLGCGVHKCQLICHCGDCQSECSFSPKFVKTCPCGKKTVESILGHSRTACTDPIPVCESLCNKTLECGHKCQSNCHLGECSPCAVTVTRKCRCGRSEKTTLCSDSIEEYLCDFPCKQFKICGRHHCKLNCCPLSFKSKKGRKVIQENDEALEIFYHSCELTCNKLLTCGNHYCKE
ncbi:hypothetical protein ROZALSC1DRAFT_28736, partial [Rozella allomycis CSF55]